MRITLSRYDVFKVLERYIETQYSEDRFEIVDWKWHQLLLGADELDALFEAELLDKKNKVAL